MTHEERLENARILIDAEIERTATLWDNEEDTYIYAWGWIDKLTVASFYDTQFCFADAIIQIAHALRVNYTLTVKNNKKGKPTPAIEIF